MRQKQFSFDLPLNNYVYTQKYGIMCDKTSFRESFPIYFCTVTEKVA